jgi:hypothetical protein
LNLAVSFLEATWQVSTALVLRDTPKEIPAQKRNAAKKPTGICYALPTKDSEIAILSRC